MEPNSHTATPAYALAHHPVLGDKLVIEDNIGYPEYLVSVHVQAGSRVREHHHECQNITEGALLLSEKKHFTYVKPTVLDSEFEIVTKLCKLCTSIYIMFQHYF